MQSFSDSYLFSESLKKKVVALTPFKFDVATCLKPSFFTFKKCDQKCVL